MIGILIKSINMIIDNKFAFSKIFFVHFWILQKRLLEFFLYSPNLDNILQALLGGGQCCREMEWVYIFYRGRGTGSAPPAQPFREIPFRSPSSHVLEGQNGQRKFLKNFDLGFRELRITNLLAQLLFNCKRLFVRLQVTRGASSKSSILLANHTSLKNMISYYYNKDRILNFFQR